MKNFEQQQVLNAMARNLDRIAVVAIIGYLVVCHLLGVAS